MAIIQQWCNADRINPPIAGLDWFAVELDRLWAERLERFTRYRTA